MQSAGKAPKIFGRSLILRCPRCGQGKFLKNWFTTNRECSNCEMLFEREEGFWVGAIFVNLIATMVLIVGGIFLLMYTTDLSMWAQIGILAAFGLVFPIAVYPISLSIWLAMNFYFTESDESAMQNRKRRSSPRW